MIIHERFPDHHEETFVKVVYKVPEKSAVGVLEERAVVVILQQVPTRFALQGDAVNQNLLLRSAVGLGRAHCNAALPVIPRSGCPRYGR